MSELQQVLGGGVGAMIFYLLYKVVDLIKEYYAKKQPCGNGAKEFCSEHSAMWAHLESIKTDVSEIKEHVIMIVREIGILEGRAGR